jgi:Ion channel
MVNMSLGRRVLDSLDDSTNDQKTVVEVTRMELSKALYMVPNLPSDKEQQSRKERISQFVLGTDRGRAILVGGIIFGLLLLGTFAMMICEGWTFVEGLYFSTYALLTVGHGDFVPDTNAGIWFTDFWLPFNVFFVALYLGSVTHIFVTLHNLNSKRIERKMHAAATSQSIIQDEEDLSQEQQDEVPPLRRTSIRQNSIQRIRQNSIQAPLFQHGTPILSARDLLRQLHDPKPSGQKLSPLLMDEPSGKTGTDIVFSDKYQAMMQIDSNDDTFALRLAVLERVAHVVCAQLMDFKSELELDGDTLKVTAHSLKDWMSDWRIPRRARASYREILIETLLFVGEKQIFDRAVGAVFDLTVVEFIELFSPFVFALGDQDEMNEWLSSTEDLAKERLPCGLEGDLESSKKALDENRRFVKSTVENCFLVNPGNAVRTKL